MQSTIYFIGDKFGNRLLYVSIALNTSLNPITLGYEEGLPIHDNWEEFIQNEVSLVFPLGTSQYFIVVNF
jgi:hypothetical protein